MQTFLASSHHKEMSYRLESLYPLPTQDQLQVKPPSSFNSAKWFESSARGKLVHTKRSSCTIQNLRDITAYEIFNCSLLYEEFLKYAKSKNAEEDVYLMRLIFQFKGYFDSSDIDCLVSGSVPPEADDIAWIIYRFFVIVGSPFVVHNLTDIQRKEIMRKLAHPDPDMFNVLEKAIYRRVRCELYAAYAESEEFERLPDVVLSKIISQQSQTIEKELDIKSSSCKKKKKKESKKFSKWKIPYFSLKFVTPSKFEFIRKDSSVACDTSNETLSSSWSLLGSQASSKCSPDDMVSN